MKKTFLVSLCSIVILTATIYSCKKDATTPTHNYMNVGYITGFDTGSCSCCGGIMITFASNATPYAAPYNLIDTAASELGIVITDTFPIKMSVDWAANTNKVGCNNYIRITKFQRQ
ncbi:MAG: hypothetical protein NTZ59_03220 [Bacteroidetes bacterium]|jgi:hypothetical protein|nr:hypothetical protein [Bacteroidota bacterium]